MSAFEWQCASEEGTDRAAPRPVAALVERDPGNPGAERAITIIAMQGREAGNESFLRQVECFIGVADAAADQTIDRLLVAAQELAERRLLPAK